MKTLAIIILSLGMISISSCGPSAEEKAMQLKHFEDSIKAHEDSLFNSAVSTAVNKVEEKSDSTIENRMRDLQTKIVNLQAELTSLNNDTLYLYNKTRLATVRARVSTGAGFGWIDVNGKFWDDKEALKAFDNAALNEKYQLAKIDSKNNEIHLLQDKIKDHQDLLSK